MQYYEYVSYKTTIFEKIVSHSRTSNANYFVISWLNAISGELIDIIKLINEVLLNRKFYNDIQKNNMLKNQIEHVMDQIIGFGKDKNVKERFQDQDSLEFL